jgi:hypothetical protein
MSEPFRLNEGLPPHKLMCTGIEGLDADTEKLTDYLFCGECTTPDVFAGRKMYGWELVNLFHQKDYFHRELVEVIEAFGIKNKKFTFDRICDECKQIIYPDLRHECE